MDELKVEVLGIEGKRVVVKIEKLRKPRRLLAYKDNKGRIIAQGGNVIFLIDPETREATYNLKGGLFVHLFPMYGAKKAKVPEEFVKALEKVLYEEGVLIGNLPDDLGGSPVHFGGCKTI